MLWLSLYFPRLLIDSLCDDDDNPVAIILRQGSQCTIIQCNPTALEVGVSPGIALNTAYALSPTLKVVEYREEQQHNIIDALSRWALQYSSVVCLEDKHSLLLEIQGSLKLFNGLDNFLAHIDKDIQDQQYLYHYGIAPTPAAAHLLARANPGARILEQDKINTGIKDIDVGFLAMTEFARKALHQSGIHNCQQLSKLPVSSLNRRFGKEAGNYLGRLLGTQPDLRTSIKAQENFEQSLDLPQETENIKILQFTLNRLIAALCGFLYTRDLGVRTLSIMLHHHRLTNTRIELHFSVAGNERKHLLRVCRARLEQTPLPAAVTAISLTAANIQAVIYQTDDLFDKHGNNANELPQLLDTLGARLGEKAIYTLITCDEHRPECASREAPSNHKTACSDQWPLRPLWLLNSPETAPAIKLISSAERIENGWAEELDIRRDYFIAKDLNTGSLYWVYTNEIAKGELLLHGIFA